VAPRILIPGALSVSIVGYVLMSFVSHNEALALVMGASVLLGVGIGMAETVSNELVLSSAPAAKAGAASAISETAYEIGAVLGTTILGGILTAMYRSHLVVPDGVPDAAAVTARETLAGAMHVADQVGGQVGAALHAAAAGAFDAGVAVTSLIGAGFVLAAAIVAATTLGRGRSVNTDRP
jgi:DHA2 family multidrug resistance protein-like MFS transporter